MAAKDAKEQPKAEEKAKAKAKAKDADAEDGEEAAAGDAAEPKKRRLAGRTLVLFIILPALLVIGGGAAAHLTGLTKSLFGGGQVEQAAKPAPAKPVVFYSLPEMIVNLNSAGRRSSFLKISISLELEQQNDIPRIESVMPRIVDNFQTYLRELRVEDLRGSAGLYRLREELLSRVNVAAAPAKVNDVLFKEMLIQ